MNPSAAEARLAAELGVRLSLIASLDTAGTDTAVHARRIAANVIESLTASDPPDGRDTVDTLLRALWPGGVPSRWWPDDLGRLVARWLTGDQQRVTQAEAAVMLGVTRGTVAQLVARGTLDRHPDGGVRRGSVMARLSR